MTVPDEQTGPWATNDNRPCWCIDCQNHGRLYRDIPENERSKR